MKNGKAGSRLCALASSLSRYVIHLLLIHHRFIMLVRQNLQSKVHSCFCHLSVGNKRERGESKENTSPRSRTWDNGCEKGWRVSLSNETQSLARMWNLEQRIITESEPSSQSATKTLGRKPDRNKRFSGKLEECAK